MKTPISLALGYTGALTLGIAVIGLGVTAVVGAATMASTPSPRDKTALETQVETSRAIKAALATPIVVPPLAPITARRANRDTRETRDVAALPARSQPASLQSSNIRALTTTARVEREQPRRYQAPMMDRHTSSW